MTDTDTETPSEGSGDGGVDGQRGFSAGSPRFDQRHLIRLYQLGLLSELPYELGSMPNFEFGPLLDNDLTRWNVINADREFTEEGAELFAGVDKWQWAAWGAVLLYDERPRVQVEIPEDFKDFGIDYAIRDIPLVSFMVTVRDEVVTVLVLNDARMSVTAEPAEYAIVKQVARIIKKFVDPHEDWKPYPLKSNFTVSLDKLTSLADPEHPRIDPDGPDRIEREDLHAAADTEADYRDALENSRNKSIDTATKEAERVKEALGGSGFSRTATNSLSELLKVHNSANAQVTVSWRSPTGKVRLDGCATGVLFFDGDDDHRGVVVSWPYRGDDGDLWVTYAPGDEDAYIDAVQNMLDMVKQQVNEP
jgi:hypothetical protein